MIDKGFLIQSHDQRIEGIPLLRLGTYNKDGIFQARGKKHGVAFCKPMELHMGLSGAISHNFFKCDGTVLRFQAGLAIAKIFNASFSIGPLGIHRVFFHFGIVPDKHLGKFKVELLEYPPTVAFTHLFFAGGIAFAFLHHFLLEFWAGGPACYALVRSIDQHGEVDGILFILKLIRILGNRSFSIEHRVLAGFKHQVIGLDDKAGGQFHIVVHFRRNGNGRSVPDPYGLFNFGLGFLIIGQIIEGDGSIQFITRVRCSNHG